MALHSDRASAVNPKVRQGHAPDPLASRRDSPVRLSFVDDHPTLTRGLEAIFGPDPRYRIGTSGRCAKDVETIARAGECDVIIVDLGLPGDVFEALRAANACQSVKLIVFTAYELVEVAIRALDAGVHAFVLKGSPLDELHAAIAAVCRGETYISPVLLSPVLTGLQSARSAAGSSRLSGRERQLVECLLEGQSNKQIAATLQLTEKTVKHYMTNLMDKLHVHSRLEVVIAAQRWVESSAGFTDLQGGMPPLPR